MICLTSFVSLQPFLDQFFLTRLFCQNILCIILIYILFINEYTVKFLVRERLSPPEKKNMLILLGFKTLYTPKISFRDPLKL